MKTYISENKFQFITDYNVYEYKDVKGESHQLDFKLLSVAERIMLSSYLTLLCSNKNSKMKKRDLYNLIFNFNEKFKRETSYQQTFIEDLTNFLEREPYYFAFVKSHYNEIVNNKTFIYRQQLNHSEMEVLYSLKFQRNYHSLMNVLYIIGVAKQNSPTSFLNKISRSLIHSNTTYANKRIDEIFKKINTVSKNEVKYKIYNGNVYFGVGFEIDETDEYYSDEKKAFNELINEKNILNSLLSKTENEETTKKEIKQPTVKTNPTKIKEEPKTAKRTIFDLGIGRLNKDLCKDFLNDEFCEHQIYFNKITDYANPVKDLGVYNEYMHIREMLNPFISSTKSDEYKVINGLFIEGEDGFDRKRAAIQNINEKINSILNYIQDFYDNDRQKYNNLLLVFLKNYEKLFNID